MKIVAKSSVDLDQLLERSRIGVEYIELQLFSKDVEDRGNIKNIIENIKDSGLKVVAVHVPISQEFSLEGINTEIGFRVIKNSCELADKLSLLTNEKIHVIMHLELDLSQLKAWGLWESINTRLKEILDSYQNITINVENLTILHYDGIRIHARNNYYFENIEVCEELIRELETNRIGTVLDTCHAINTIRYVEDLKDTENNISLKDYFIENKD